MSMNRVSLKNVVCKKCGTILGKRITEWKLGILNTIAIQPYLSTQIKDGIVDCPTCSSKVDISIPN